MWEAIGALRKATRRIDGVSNGSYIYLDDLRKVLPNWGKNLEQLSLSYTKNLQKMNIGLVACQTRFGCPGKWHPWLGTYSIWKHGIQFWWRSRRAVFCYSN
jgi:hypothetical protein